MRPSPADRARDLPRSTAPDDFPVDRLSASPVRRRSGFGTILTLEWFVRTTRSHHGHRSSRHLNVLLGCLAVLLSVLSGCSPVQQADLVIHNGPEPESIDPHILTGQADGRIAAALFEGLTRFNPTNATAIPGLASHWDVTDEGRVYTFHLRRNLRWSTGEPITAEDVVWSWQRAVNPLTGADYASQFFYLENGEAISTGQETDLSRLGVRALDSHTVQVRLVNPTPFVLELLAARIFAVIPKWTVEAYGDQWILSQPLPCSGPYTLDAWRVNDRIRLQKNPNYWDADRVQLERIDLVAGDAPMTALNLYLTGVIDYLIDQNMIPVDLGDALMLRPDFHQFDYLGTYFLRFNCTRKPFDDVRVRKAISLVIDRDRIVTRITRKGENPTGALVPAGTRGYEPPAGLGRDVELARRLLAEAGYPEGRGFPVFEYAFNVGTKIHEQVAIELQSALREHLGLRMELRPLEWKTYLMEMSKLNFDMIRGSWIGDYTDPNTFLDMFLSDSGNNRTGWRNADYDRWIQAANAESDSEKRYALLFQAESLLVEEALPILCLYNYVGFYAIDTNRFGGVFPNLLDEHPFWAIYKRPPNPSTP